MTQDGQPTPLDAKRLAPHDLSRSSGFKAIRFANDARSLSRHFPQRLAQLLNTQRLIERGFRHLPPHFVFILVGSCQQILGQKYFKSGPGDLVLGAELVQSRLDKQLLDYQGQ